jgi:Glycosyl hydrolase family 57
MNHLTRRAFIAAAPLLSPAMQLAARNHFDPQRDSIEAKHPPLPGVSAAGGEEPAADQQQAATQRVINQFRHMPAFRKKLAWKLAYTQHSMYMLIDEDRGEPTIGERTSPWGAPNASVYVDRIRRNLASLESVPGLLLSYDFPGVDIESIGRDFPDVLEQMRRMHKKGVLNFVNGTYSGAHLHILSSESNWRQFEYGLEVFERLFGTRVKTFAFQETGLSQQLPQILKLFGYEMITAPGGFPWAMEIVDGPFEMESSHNGTDFLREEEFVWAEALDNTKLPFYLVEPIPVDGDFNGDWNIKRAIDLGLVSPPPVWLYCPDMNEVEQKTCDSIAELFDFVLLDRELPRRARQAPPRAKARIFSYWSYAEGVWGEELLRANRAAEQAALVAEAVQAMARQAGLSIDRKEELRKIWRTIIKYQCHDIMWIEVTDLRRKGIEHDNHCATESYTILKELAAKLVGSEGNSLAIFNGLPTARRALIEIEGDEVPGGGRPFQEFEGKALGLRDLPPGGFCSFPIARGGSTPSNEISLASKIATAHYTLELSNGLISQITTEYGKVLLESDKYLGGELRAMIHDQWQDNRSADSRLFEGEVCYILTRTSYLGDVPVKERYFFFRNENFIRAELEFDFHGNGIGNFWMDETKLNVYYPTRGDSIYYDIPFGYISGRANRPLFVANWLWCGGLVYVNWGTVKHWVRNGVIANVLAWGGNAFDNRIDFDFWVARQQYDLRLYGKQKIKYALIPIGEFDRNKIVHEVNHLTSPAFVTKGSGMKSFYKAENENLAVTAVFEKQSKVWARGYKLPTGGKTNYRDFEIFNCPIEDLEQSGPFR